MTITIPSLRARPGVHAMLALLLMLMIGADTLGQPRRAPRQDFRLHVGRFHWDPAVTLLPPSIRPDPALAQSTYVVVQFRRPLNANQRAVMRQRGMRLDQYVDYLGFIEKRSAVDEIPGNLRPLVRAIVPYAPAFKSIGVLEAIDRGNAPPGSVVRIIVDMGEDPTVVRNEIVADLGRVLLTIPSNPPGWAIPEIRLTPTDRKQIIAILEREDVRWIEWMPVPRADDGSDDAAYLQSGTAAAWPVWVEGLTGQSQHVGVIDLGVPRQDHCFLSNTLTNVRSVITPEITNHATRAAGIVAGDEAGSAGAHVNRGHSWSGSITYGNAKDVGPEGTDTLAGYLDAAAADGASVHTNSWHFDAEEWMAFPGDTAVYQYDYTAHKADAFMWNDETQVVVASASNSDEPLGPPAVAFNALAVGAAKYATWSWMDGSGDLTDDGRTKPEVCTPGCLVETSDTRDVCAIAHDYACAASWAAPAAAGAAVLVRQYFIDGHYSGDWTTGATPVPSSALVRAMLINATKKLYLYNGVYPCPFAGFGAVVLDDVLWFSGDKRMLYVHDVLNEHGLDVEGSTSYTFNVWDATEELRVTLAWTVPPGTPPWPAGNDLDLIVMSPDGVMLNNQGLPTETVDTSPNKAEIVRVVNPMLGAWTVKVRAGEIVNLPDERRQGYAICISGAINTK